MFLSKRASVYSQFSSYPYFPHKIFYSLATSSKYKLSGAHLWTLNKSSTFQVAMLFLFPLWLHVFYFRS